MSDRDLEIREAANDGAMGISIPRETSDEDAYRRGAVEALRKVRARCDAWSRNALGPSADGSDLIRARALGRKEAWNWAADEIDALLREYGQ
jgi:hypothetical protein